MSSTAYGATDGSMDDDDKYAPHQRTCCVRFGNTHVLCAAPGAHYFPLMWHVGPHWPCMLVTYAISLGPLAFFFMCVRVVSTSISLLASIKWTGSSSLSLSLVDTGDH